MGNQAPGSCVGQSGPHNPWLLAGSAHLVSVPRVCRVSPGSILARRGLSVCSSPHHKDNSCPQTREPMRGRPASLGGPWELDLGQDPLLSHPLSPLHNGSTMLRAPGAHRRGDPLPRRDAYVFLGKVVGFPVWDWCGFRDRTSSWGAALGPLTAPLTGPRDIRPPLGTPGLPLWKQQPTCLGRGSTTTWPLLSSAPNCCLRAQMDPAPATARTHQASPCPPMPPTEQRGWRLQRWGLPLEAHSGVLDPPSITFPGLCGHPPVQS